MPIQYKMMCSPQLLLLVAVVAVSSVEMMAADESLHDDVDGYLTDIKLHLANIRTGREGHGVTGQLMMEPCPVACQYDYTPVCGSDGQTYSNRCELALTACRQRMRVFVEKAGVC